MPAERNRQIDNLKGFCAILVALFHVFFRYHQIYHPGMEPQWMRYLGETGVCVFVVISGYFLCTKDKSGFPKSLFSYYLKRILRLWPLYVICITITWSLATIFGLPGRSVSFKDYLLNIPFINGFIGKPYVDGAHWYMTTLISLILVYGLISAIPKIEDKFYIYIIWLVVCVILILTEKTLIAQLLGGPYLANALCGLSFRKIKEANDTKQKIGWISLIILCFSSVLIITNYAKLLCHSIAFILVLLAFSNKIKILENPISDWFADKAYALYLFHQNVAYIIILHIEALIGSYHLWMSIAALVIVILCSIFLSFIEKKIKHLTEHIQASPEHSETL